AYFTKPLVIEEVIHRVEQALDRQRLWRELRESEEAIKLAHAELDQIFNTAADGMCVVDKDFNILRTNEAFSTMAGIGKDEAAGKKCCEVFPCSLRHTAGCALTRILGGEERVECEVEKKRKDGARIPCIMTATPFRGSGGKLIGIVESFKDITKRKQVQEALRESEKRYMELSITDGLTRLYNSRYFYNQLKSEIERVARYKHSLSLLLLDVDNFKHYNDNYGHLEGDKVLVRLGEVIRGCIREVDSAYRYGGEEFTVMLPVTESKKAIAIAERIRKRFETETFSPTPEDTVHVTVSIGTAQYQPDEKLSVFVNRADEAMYEAKKQGKNRAFFSQSNRR
ncbi:GGDEF domain-containing protein, partial [bacterium]|nr:GGDEF domain-containing protein [bacterium]